MTERLYERDEVAAGHEEEVCTLVTIKGERIRLYRHGAVAAEEDAMSIKKTLEDLRTPGKVDTGKDEPSRCSGYYNTEEKILSRFARNFSADDAGAYRWED